MISYSFDPTLKENKAEDVLSNPPKIVTVNTFTEASAKEFRKDFNEAVDTGQPIIPILIDSFGGQCYALLSMIDTIRMSPVPVATIVSGKAMSCGALLFSFGTEGYRIVNPMATVLIHDVSSFSFGKVEEIKADAGEVERLNQMVYRAMARNCGKPETYFLDIVHDKGHADWFLTPEECVKHNLANRIGTFQLKVAVKTTITF